MKHREKLPPIDGKPCLTDGGLETTLVFLDGIELPEFAAIHMVGTEGRRAHLQRYFEDYIQIARAHGVGVVLESPTWRSSWGWADALGYTIGELDALNRSSIGMLLELRSQYETSQTPVVVSGCIGPRGDGYVAADKMTSEAAREYHQPQVQLFAEAGVDCVTAMTINYVEEAIGIAQAASKAGLPSVISFTVETDGRLVTGDTLEAAICEVDASAEGAPAYYMINCAHPVHFANVLDPDADWVKRIVGIRANASKCSHEELDNSEELDIGDPEELAGDYKQITAAIPHIKVVGGCCGTDIRHIRAIAELQFGASEKVERVA